MDASFARVAQAIAAHLARAPALTDEVDAAVRHLARSAEIALPREDFVAASNRDHTTVLAPAIAAGLTYPAAGIAAALAALPGPLPWRYSYPPRPGLPADAVDLAERIAFAELIGPRAPLDAPGCRAGFTLIAPATFYPLHAHPAIELYLVISGHAQWTTPEAERIVPPGEFVLHGVNQPHAMRTFAEPLLALYGWRGDIDAPAFYL
jgi:mannose-6-phosphate isomerase-like protein (cupin superfamily)